MLFIYVCFHCPTTHFYNEGKGDRPLKGMQMMKRVFREKETEGRWWHVIPRVAAMALLLCGCVERAVVDVPQMDILSQHDELSSWWPDLGAPQFPQELPYPVGIERSAYLEGFVEGWIMVQEGQNPILVLPGLSPTYDAAWAFGADQGKKSACHRLETILEDRLREEKGTDP